MKSADNSSALLVVEQKNNVRRWGAMTTAQMTVVLSREVWIYNRDRK